MTSVFVCLFLCLATAYTLQPSRSWGCIFWLCSRVLLMLLKIKWKFGKILLFKHYLLYCFYCWVLFIIFFSLHLQLWWVLFSLLWNLFPFPSSQIILLLIIKVNISTRCRKKENLGEQKREQERVGWGDRLICTEFARKTLGDSDF